MIDIQNSIVGGGGSERGRANSSWHIQRMCVVGYMFVSIGTVSIKISLINEDLIKLLFHFVSVLKKSAFN